MSKTILYNLALSVFRPWPGQKKKKKRLFLILSQVGKKERSKVSLWKKFHFIKYHYCFYYSYFMCPTTFRVLYTCCQELTEITVNYFNKYQRENRKVLCDLPAPSVSHSSERAHHQAHLSPRYG